MIGIPDDDIGGAYVARTFTNKGRSMKRGDRLTSDEVLSMPIANRRALVDAGFMVIRPKPEAAERYEKAERFVIMTGKGEFGVIEGRKINDAPLSKEAAEKLAAR